MRVRARVDFRARLMLRTRALGRLQLRFVAGDESGQIFPEVFLVLCYVYAGGICRWCMRGAGEFVHEFFTRVGLVEGNLQGFGFTDTYNRPGGASVPGRV